MNVAFWNRDNPSGARPADPANRGSLVAAAAQIDLTDVTTWQKIFRLGDNRWQYEAWRHYDLCGEMRFVVNWVGSALSRCRMYAAQITDTGEIGDEVEDAQVKLIAETMFGSPAAKALAQKLMGIDLMTVGEFYVIAEGYAKAEADKWYILAPEQVIRKGSQIVVRRSIMHGGGEYELVPKKDLIIRVWNPHPRRFDAADSTVRAVLPTLRKLESVNKRIFAELDSRLAGNGLLILPDNIDFPAGPDDEARSIGSFMKILERAMAASLQQRDSAAAVVPIGIQVPPDAIGKIQHLMFDSKLSDQLIPLYDGAVKVLATSLDVPAEVLMGMGDTNHWCNDDQTEILTRHGWATVDTFRPGDEVLSLNPQTGAASWTPTDAVYVADVTDEPMRALESRTHSSLTTLNHRWPTRTPWGTLRWRTTAELSATDILTTGAPVADLPVVAKYSDALVELAAWFWTEGNLSAGGTLTIAQSHIRSPDRVARIRTALLGEFGPGGYTESTQSSHSSYGGPITVFRLRSPARDALLGAVGSKWIAPSFVDALTAAQLHLFIDTSCAGDGVHWRAGERDIWQREPAALDAYERACILAGYATSRQPGHSGGTVIRALRATSVRPVKAAEQMVRTGGVGAIDQVVAYTGRIWCPTVPGNHTYLARRNGHVFYTGNSAWQVEETTIKIHIEPVLIQIADALNIGYFQPALRAAKVANPEKMTLWFDTSALTVRPNRSDQAFQAQGVGIISDEAARKYADFTDEDAPDDKERAYRLVEKIVLAQPNFAADPQVQKILGLPAIQPAPTAAPPGLDQGMLMPGQPGYDQAGTEPADAGTRALPTVKEAESAGRAGTPPTDSRTASGLGADRKGARQLLRDTVRDQTGPDTLYVACDAAVRRALEVAGGRLVGGPGRDRYAGTPRHELHTQVVPDASRVPSLLAGAWAHVREQASDLGYAPDPLVGLLEGYATQLLVTGTPHSRRLLEPTLEAARRGMT